MLYKEYNLHWPKLPNSLSDLGAILDDTGLMRGFYMGTARSEDGGVAVVFSTNLLLSELNSARIISVDGTFAVSSFRNFNIQIDYFDYVEVELEKLSCYALIFDIYCIIIPKASGL